jgi:hypothetical protein
MCFFAPPASLRQRVDVNLTQIVNERTIQSRSMATGHLGLAKEIDAFRQQFEQIAAEGDALVAPLSDEQFYWQPSPESWSIAQCIEHLNVTAREYLPKLDEGIAEAIRRGQYGEGPFTYSRIGRLMVRTTEPPPRIRVRAPKQFHPPNARRRQEVMAAFRAYQVQYVDRLRQANGLDLGRAKVRSPVASWLRFSLGSGFALMVAHERRHLWQARNVAALSGFPPA